MISHRKCSDNDSASDAGKASTRAKCSTQLSLLKKNKRKHAISFVIKFKRVNRGNVRKIKQNYLSGTKIGEEHDKGACSLLYIYI